MNQPVDLSQATLEQIPEGIERPTYLRSAVRIGIVHIGVGGFHRAHQAMYLERLLEANAGTDWGICGVGVLPGDARMAESLHAQDGLYTLVEKDSNGALTARVIGSIVKYLHAPNDPEAVIEQMASPDTRIVSLTITEGGYSMDTLTGEFDRTNSAIRQDLENVAPPSTVFGLVTEALRRRRDRVVPGFTIMSCDNIEGTGHAARQAFVGYARLVDADLAAWIEDNVTFPSSMVDRITPVTTDVDVALVRERLGIADRWPVVCEPFAQWVLEDSFVSGRPPLERVGVQIVADVRPYELMKLRLLNASHQAVCYFAYLAGYRLVHEACQDPLFSRFLADYMHIEGAPTLEPVPGIDLDSYQRQLIERFSNGDVRDTVARLCADSSDRIPKWLLPVIRAQLAAGGPIRRATAVVASWARYSEGFDDHGEPIDVVDRLAPMLHELAVQGGTAFIDNRSIFGDLADDERFRKHYSEVMTWLHQNGARATLERLLI